MTQRRSVSILHRRKDRYKSYLDTAPDSGRSSQELLRSDGSNSDDLPESYTAARHPPKKRKIFGVTITTPNSSRFKDNIHSRVLSRFPFMIEMFYWVINYAFYRMTAVLSQRLFAKTGIWQVAESHGIAVLGFEQFGPLSFLFPIHERTIQLWFMDGHQTALTVLNKAYALIHIPGTVGYVFVSD